MPLSPKDVEAIARLSRLSLTAGEVKMFGGQLDAILGYVDTLGKLDLTNVEPTAQVGAGTDRTRPDRVTPGVARDDVEAMAPEFRAGSVRVPRILEE